MADQEQLRILRQSIEQWNKWREEHPEIQNDLSHADIRGMDLGLANLSNTDLSGANLSGDNLIAIDLSGANLSSADLSRANLSGANLINANLSRADLTLVNLSGADLREANLNHAHLNSAYLHDTNFGHARLINTDLSSAYFSNANLRGVNFSGDSLRGANLSDATLSRAHLSGADLSGANLRDTDLSGANLSGANLSGADLSRADLSRADLSNATIGRTSFGDRDMREIKGLTTIQHRGPSPLSINSLYLSEGDIPEVFVRGTGAPDNFIEYMHALAAKPIQYYTCFISYSSKNQDFAERLYADLQSKGVRCWFAPEDLKIGDHFPERIEQAIRTYDKLLVILSEYSVYSLWVEDEVRAAQEKEERFKQEQHFNKTVLFPVAIDTAIEQAQTQWAARLRRQRHIGQFVNWKDHDSYQQAFQRLLRDLEANTTEQNKQDA